jgi:protein O-mannosyl-transferase
MGIQVAEGRPPSDRVIVPKRRGVSINVWLGLALVGLIAVVYAPVRHHAFLNYDDNEYVTDNPHVTAGLTRDSFVWAWTQPHSATWHPLTTLSHLLDCQLFGLTPGPPHVANVLLHASSTLLLFGLLVRMTGRPWRSACVAALFGIHPLHIESVAWVAERKDVLSTVFWMLTLWAYVGYVRRPQPRRYALVLAAYVAALLSKPMVVTLPFALLLLDVWPLQRLRGWHAREGESSPCVPPRPHALTVLLIEKLPLLALAGAASAITILTQRHAGAVVSLQRSSFADRVANALVSYVAYLVKMLWPSGLAPIYPFVAPLPVWQVLGATGLLAAVTVGAVWSARRAPYLLVGWLWYVGTLVPVIGLVQYGSHAMADRYTYVPSIGIFLMVVWGIADWFRTWEHRRIAGAMAGSAAIAAYAVVTAIQLRHWQDSVSLFRHTLSVTRDNAVAELHLGVALVAQGQREEGSRHISAGERITRETEVRHYARVLQSDPTAIEAHVKLARLLADSGDTNGAAAQYRDVIGLNPSLAGAHNNLAVILESTGRTDEAIAEYREGVRLEPQRAESRSNLAAILASAGHPTEAIEQFQAALQLQPQLAAARFGLASAYAQAGNVRLAIAELDDLLRQQPNWTAVAATLAWLLATSDDPSLRDPVRAVQLAEAAARRTEQSDADVLGSLAAAYAAAGRFPEAVRAAERGLDLARAGGRTPLATALTERLAHYRAGLALPADAGRPSD